MIGFKSSTTSGVLRGEGNEFYAQRKFFYALLKYNESLSYAELDTANLGLAYANRSAVYFEMKLYERCLRNIEYARKNHYPEENFEILKKREEKCKDLMKTSREKLSDPWNTFKLSYPPHKQIPFIAECLEVQSNEKFGRFVVTNRQLRVGDIVAIEKPFCSILIAESKFHENPESNIYQRCTNCLKENALDLIPCGTCSKGSFHHSIK